MKQFVDAVLDVQQTLDGFYLDRQFCSGSLNTRERTLLRKAVLVVEELECELQEHHSYRQCDFCKDAVSHEFGNMSDNEACSECEHNSADRREYEAAHMHWGKL
jgi:hypothetical protein